MTSDARLLVAWITAAAVVGAPRVADAAPSKRAKPAETEPAPAPAPAEPAPEMPAAVDPALAAAQKLYSRGLTHYETLDYDLAIESWKDALAKLREADVGTPEKGRSVASARTAIVYNIARAQQRAFEQDRDVARLKKARGLLEIYVRESAEAGTVDEAELEVARARIQEISDQIADAERPVPVQPQPQPQPDKGPKPGRGLIAGGATALVIGVGAVVGGAVGGTSVSGRAESKVAGLDELGDEAARRDELARGKTGDTVLIACTVAGGVVAVAGVVMLALGVKRSKARARAPVASFGAGVVTLGIAGRF